MIAESFTRALSGKSVLLPREFAHGASRKCLHVLVCFEQEQKVLLWIVLWLNFCLSELMQSLSGGIVLLPYAFEPWTSWPDCVSSLYRKLLCKELSVF